MPISEAKRKANNKWNNKNRVTFGCSTNKEEAAAFRAYAEQWGKTPNALLKGFILSCIADMPKDSVNIEHD